MPKLLGVNHLRAIKALEKGPDSGLIGKANMFSCRKARHELWCHETIRSTLIRWRRSSATPA